MSIFSETTTKIDKVYDGIVQGFLSERNRILERLDKFLEEFENEQKQKNNSRVKHTLMTTLQSINEDEVLDERDQISNDVNIQSEEPNAAISQLQSDEVLSRARNQGQPPFKSNERDLPERENEKQSDINNVVPEVLTKDTSTKRVSKKRVKDEVGDILSPEIDKRQKRSASVKAQSSINKMVNMNLNQKLRRDDTTEDQQASGRRRKGRKDIEGDKENTPPPITIKQEKISMPIEPMDVESLLIVEKKERVSELIMPPPPVPRARRLAKEKSKDNVTEGIEESEQTERRSRTRTKKQPSVTSAEPRSTRSNSRVADTASEGPPAQEGRPKRTKKKQLNEISGQGKEDAQQPLENGRNGEDTPEKPRPKRTRKAPQKYIDNEDSLKKDGVPSLLQLEKEKSKESATEEMSVPPHVEKKKNGKLAEQHENIPQSTRIPIPIEKSATHLHNENVLSSPILEMRTKTNFKRKAKGLALEKEMDDAKLELEKTRILNTDKNVTVTLNKLSTMNSTVVLPSSKFNHDPVTPKAVKKMDETVVVERGNTVLPPAKAEQPRVMNDTVVLSKDGTPQSNILTDDNSFLTDDNSEAERTPPHPKEKEENAPKSAVKEKVQQFEQMATRLTRTKTKAKKAEEDNVTPPDNTIRPKAALSAEMLSKLNNVIFNGKPPTTSSSATKPKVNNVVSNVKSFLPNSTSKLNTVAKTKEAPEETLKKEKEDARKKREALLQAKREEQKRKREEKMAAAAAAREAAERDRQLALEAALKERLEKQAHADLGKLERQKEAERKKQELARKVAETEERRRAEEQARLQKLAEEQKRAELARKRQQEEAEATKREVALATKELEKRKKEYIEKQKMQQRQENRMNTPLRMPGTPGVPLPPMEPVHMADGFQYLNSDDDDFDKPSKKPDPAWSTNKARLQQLRLQSIVKVEHVDRLFSVRRHSPDLREIFPSISRHALKRTSSAVWRTPPGLKLHTVHE